MSGANLIYLPLFTCTREAQAKRNRMRVAVHKTFYLFFLPSHEGRAKVQGACIPLIDTRSFHNEGEGAPHPVSRPAKPQFAATKSCPSLRDGSLLSWSSLLPASRPQQRFPDSPRTNSTPRLPTPRGATAMHLTRTSVHGILPNQT